MANINYYLIALISGSEIQSFTVPIVGAPNWDEWLKGWRSAGYELLEEPVKV